MGGKRNVRKDPEPTGTVAALVDAREAELRRGGAIAAQRISEGYGGNDSAAARSLGLEQPVLNAAKRGEGLGLRTLLKLGAATGRSLDQIAALSTEDAVVPITRGMKLVLGESNEWAKAVAAAKASPVHLPEWAWRAAGGVALPLLPRQITPELALAVAQLVAVHCDASQEIRVPRKKTIER